MKLTVFFIPLASFSNPVNAKIEVLIPTTSLMYFAKIGAEPDPVPPSVDVTTTTLSTSDGMLSKRSVSFKNDTIAFFEIFLSFPHPLRLFPMIIALSLKFSGISFSVLLISTAYAGLITCKSSALITALLPAAPSPKT